MTKACMSLLAESLRGELATFNITVTVIEPGYFRTGFLRPGAGAQVQPQRRMDVYEDPNSTTGKIRQTLQAVAGNQPGDPKKGTKVCVDVLTRTGVAEGKDAVPARIVLGTDCEQVIRSQCQAALSYLDDRRLAGRRVVVWQSTNSYSPQDTTLLPSGSGLLKRYPPALDQSPNESFDLARARGILLATPLVRTTTNSTIVGIHHASTTIIQLAMSTPPNESDSSIIFFLSLPNLLIDYLPGLLFPGEFSHTNSRPAGSIGRALDYGSRGCRFESCVGRWYSFYPFIVPSDLLFFP
ncbi:hypothetical protein VTO42DRAFT_1722 [Malbranchea cinnamomea]